ncbi:MAG: hypothetical protein MI725_14430, partial [Pirellulales bacterium]|nr:hypothetical protein [Pirellulales bacterium]
MKIASRLPLATWMIALVMALCLIGMSHDAAYVGSSEEFSVERGAGWDQREKFEKNVSLAPLPRQASFLILIGVGVYCGLTARRGVTVKIGPILLLMAACLTLVMASFFWSVDSAKTTRELIRIVVYLGIAAAVARRFQPREICFILGAMATLSVLVACGAEIASGAFRPWHAGYRLRGSLHTNVLASQAVVAALVAFAFLQQSRRPWLLRSIFVA